MHTRECRFINQIFCGALKNIFAGDLKYAIVNIFSRRSYCKPAKQGAHCLDTKPQLHEISAKPEV